MGLLTEVRKDAEDCRADGSTDMGPFLSWEGSPVGRGAPARLSVPLVPLRSSLAIPLSPPPTTVHHYAAALKAAQAKDRMVAISAHAHMNLDASSVLALRNLLPAFQHGTRIGSSITASKKPLLLADSQFPPTTRRPRFRAPPDNYARYSPLSCIVVLLIAGDVRHQTPSVSARCEPQHCAPPSRP